MVRRSFVILTSLLASLIVTPLPVHAAQTPATARLIVTVLDPTNASVPGATVTLLGLEDATKREIPPPVRVDLPRGASPNRF